MKITIDASENGASSLGTVSTKSAATNIDHPTKYRTSPSHGEHIRLDISGNVMDNNAYAGHGKTAEDVMQAAGSQDIVARRNYMAIMSNTMSKEDFAKLQRDGTPPGDTEIGTVVTIIDHIKAALVKGGKEVHGFTDNLDAEALEAITGDKVMAQKLARQFQEKGLPLTDENIDAALKAWEKAREIPELPEGAVKYMVENDLPPTIENLYLARFSGAKDAGRQGRGYFAQNLGMTDASQSTYFAKKADSFDWDQLKPQIEKVVREAGYDNNEETLNRGRWLIEKGIPLTAAHFTALSQIKELKLPQDRAELAAAITAAILDGKNPLNADLLDPRSNMEKAVRYFEDVQRIKPEAAAKVVSNEQMLNLKNLIAAQGKTTQITIDRPSQSTAVTAESPQLDASEKIITAQRVLLETSLIMTVTANLRLLRSGFSIETAPLEQLVSQLKEAEKAVQSQLVGSSNENEAITTNRFLLYHETLAKTDAISAMPAALIGRMTHIAPIDLVPAAGTLASLQEIHDHGAALQVAYEKAGEVYEKVMTAPRPDMGDSIQKAFRNVDGILNELSLAVTDENRRAIRILGYNSMEINHDNINAIKEKDAQLQDILTKMKPGTVLNMIREGLNPLTMSLGELQSILNGKDETVAEEIESYSQFLAKLDRKGDITPTERNVYIGVYRLLRQIEKGESKAVGSLINAEMDFSLGNLLTAMRSKRRQGMDYRVNDDFGSVRAVKSTVSLEASLEKLHQLLQNNNNSQEDPGLRENLRDIIESLELAEVNEAYLAEQVKDIRSLKNIENEMIQTLLDHKQPVTVNNLIAALKLAKKPGELHQKAKEKAEETGLEAILADAKENLVNNFTDEESATAAYDDLQKVMTDIFARAAEKEQTNTLDLKELSSMCRQLNFRAAIKTAQVNEERYDIPVEIDGELTAINLLLRHDSESAGKVSCAMDSASYGSVTAEFIVNNGKIEGHVAINNDEGLKKLAVEADNLYTTLDEMLITKSASISEIGEIHFIKSNLKENENIIKNPSTEEQDKSTDAEKVSNKELYLVAKAFITFVKRG